MKTTIHLPRHMLVALATLARHAEKKPFNSIFAIPVNDAGSTIAYKLIVSDRQILGCTCHNLPEPIKKTEQKFRIPFTFINILKNSLESPTEPELIKFSTLDNNILQMHTGNSTHSIKTDDHYPDASEILKILHTPPQPAGTCHLNSMELQSIIACAEVLGIPAFKLEIQENNLIFLPRPASQPENFAIITINSHLN
jgi:hypothetical protein